MVRLLAFLVGLFFSGMLLIAFGYSAYTAMTETVTPTAEHEFHEQPLAEKFPHDGPLGTYRQRSCSAGSRCIQKFAPLATA